jgi:hypothetical protein
MQIPSRIRALSLSTLGLWAGAALAVPVTLDLLTDEFGGETSFQMVFDPDGVATSVPFDTGTPAVSPAFDDSFVTENELSGYTNYLFSWDLSPGAYEFTIFDSWGDGICCGWGSGSYTLTTPDQTIIGDNFTGSSEVSSFSVQGTVPSVQGTVPLPATAALLALGIGVLGWSRRRARA